MKVDTYDALIDAIEANRERPIFVVGDRWVVVHDLKLEVYVKAPPRQHGYGYNVEVRCGAQWVMGTPYRTEEAKTAFFTALADVLHAAAVVDKAMGMLHGAAV